MNFYATVNLMNGVDTDSANNGEPEAISTTALVGAGLSVAMVSEGLSERLRPAAEALGALLHPGAGVAMVRTTENNMEIVGIAMLDPAAMAQSVIQPAQNDFVAVIAELQQAWTTRDLTVDDFIVAQAKISQIINGGKDGT